MGSWIGRVATVVGRTRRNGAGGAADCCMLHGHRRTRWQVKRLFLQQRLLRVARIHSLQGEVIISGSLDRGTLQ